MKISLITPTADRQFTFALAEKYVSRQTVKPFEWIVADDGLTPTVTTMNQIHVRRERTHEGGKSLASNLLAALDRVKGDAVVIWEDDDWYSPQHLQVCAERLQGASATGCQWLRYYNVAHRMHVRMQNIGSALCNTAFRSELIGVMRSAAQDALDNNDFYIDRRFWQSVNSKRDCHDIETVIGMKGLPGRAGLGIGHRPKRSPSKRWAHDPSKRVLREWLGPDAEPYLSC